MLCPWELSGLCCPAQGRAALHEILPYDAGDATSPAPFTPEVLSPALPPSETPAAAAAAAQAAQEQKAWLATAIAKAARAAAPNAHLDASTNLPPVNITLPVRCMTCGGIRKNLHHCGCTAMWCESQHHVHFHCSTWKFMILKVSISQPCRVCCGIREATPLRTWRLG